MKKTLCYILAFLLVCAMTACVINPQKGTDPTTDTTVPSSGQTTPEDPTGGASGENGPVSTQPKPTMPEVGTDPGGFGPIF